MKSTLLTRITTLSLMLIAPIGQAFTFYDDPLPVQHYVTDADKAIKDSLLRNHWEIISESNGLFETVLNHKGYKLKLNIRYNDEAISFEQISAERTDCTRAHCKVQQRHIDRWRLNLRRHIAKELHQRAILDAEASLAASAT